MSRTLGRSGIKVSDIGFGCWAIGGPFTLGGRPDGWGEVDDAESTAAVSRALELGITFFGTADVYGAGHSERVLGRRRPTWPRSPGCSVRARAASQPVTTRTLAGGECP